MSLLQAIARAGRSFMEQRRSMRELVQFPAWIKADNESRIRECTILDVSDGGARILVSAPSYVTKEFWLLLTKDGTRRRRCRIAWRSDDQIGVSYLGPPQSITRSSVLN